MVFSSALFVFYFLPVFLLAYLATPPPYRNWTALAGSLAFYAWGAPLFIFVLIASSLADHFIARKIGHDLARTNYDVDRTRRTAAADRGVEAPAQAAPAQSATARAASMSI